MVTLREGKKALAYVWTVDLLKGAPVWTTASMTDTVLDSYLKVTKAWREEYENRTRRSEQT